MTIAVCALLALVIVRIRVPHLRRPDRRGIGPGFDRRVAGLLRIGLSGGLPPVSALEAAAAELLGDERAELERIVRTVRIDGATAGLLSAGGPLAGMLRRLAAAHAAGAPMAETLAVHAAEARVRERARLLQRSRTLPVRLVVPLTLLLLPGFVALVPGPSVVEQIRSLSGALP